MLTMAGLTWITHETRLKSRNFFIKCHNVLIT
jgi:hypothetical protein